MPSEIERLYREHRAGLVRLVERELRDRQDAEDVVQTAFLDAQRALEGGTIPRNPPAWLATIALNAARRLRRRRLNAAPLEEYAVQEASRMPEIRAALTALPPGQRAAVLYRDVLGLSYGEAAEQMGTSVTAVTMLLHRGRQRLRQTLAVMAGGVGLSRWLRQAGMPQMAAVKGAAAVVVAAGLATSGGIVASRVVASTGPHLAAALATRSAGPTARAGQTPSGRAAALGAVRRHLVKTTQSQANEGPASTPPSPESIASSTAGAPASSQTQSQSTPLVRLPTVPLPTVSIPSLPVTVPATVAVTTPIVTATVTTPLSTTVTVTTPIATVTVPIP